MKTIALGALVLIAAAGLAMPARAQMDGMGGDGSMGGMGAGSMGGIGAHGPGTLPPQDRNGSHGPEGEAEGMRAGGRWEAAGAVMGIRNPPAADCHAPKKSLNLRWRLSLPFWT